VSHGLYPIVLITGLIGNLQFITNDFQIRAETGMTVRDAVYLLENKGLRVEFDGLGRVKRQSLRPGSKASRGKRIRIELG